VENDYLCGGKKKDTGTEAVGQHVRKKVQPNGHTFYKQIKNLNKL
jgi:hypothetical protein